MKKIKLTARPVPADLRLSPDKRVVSKFDPVSVAEFPVAERETMGLRVVDDCAEEHIM